MTGPVHFEALEPGQEVVRLVKPAITRDQLARYAGASGDFTAFHLDSQVARSVGLDGVIAHGMLLMGMIAEAVTGWLPNRYLKRLEFRFRGMTYPGDIITIVGRVTETRIEGTSGLVRCSIEAVDQKGETKGDGGFEAGLPL
jgi:acyl dehydratase